ncbi:MAG: acyltransferase [Melioribacteraceae bacterium]|nr:acyltransferase [Melioribacteraceae bacterium]
MKTGLGLKRKFRTLFSYYNLLKFWLRIVFIGFDYANLLLQKVDKYSIKLILKKNGAQIGENCDIETGLTFHNCKNYSNLIIGNNCHIGKNCFFDLREKVIIGKNVVISMQCTFITHIDMSKSNLSKLFKSESHPINISDNTYIGANSIILMGVKIDNLSFIAADSLVNKNVEPKTMVGGVPAKFIKKLDIHLGLS